MVEIVKIMVTSFKRSHAHTAAPNAPHDIIGRYIFIHSLFIHKEREKGLEKRGKGDSKF